MADWSCPFFDPIELPDSRRIETLRDAATFITKLPKREHDAPEWQAAIEALMLVADLGGPTMLARIGMLRALNRRKQVTNPRKKHAKGVQDRQMIQEEPRGPDVG
ncbi:hypothetical protein [Bradyrhizobium liaoningense]|uniref:hypothetical protein n=1 Tax=Bradyrhizobium liaoningense TaxID=43992 RepID=UPI001BADEE8A|nr:hypothetical protein [Bradyrhizobium liaoningense]MBR0719818.1 hypothetical protein [Bradyrhizobium liaoningense]